MKHADFLRCAVTGSLLIGLGAFAKAQTTWYVDVHGTPPGSGTVGDPYTSIQYAIDRPTTVGGDRLLVAPGTYVENVDTHGKWIFVDSQQGPLATTIRPSQLGTVVRLQQFSGGFPPTRIEGFTITGYLGGGADDAAVRCDLGWVRRCIVRDNTAGNGIGVVAHYGCSLYACTIVGNSIGVLVDSFDGILDMQNSIAWGNGLDLKSFDVFTTYVNYCAGGLSGPNTFFNGSHNIVGDPKLWSLASNDLRLLPGSPCIDAGDPAAPHDPDGSIIDIGALIYDPTYAPAPTAYCTAKLNSQGCTPAIGSNGSASTTSSAPFAITASNWVENKTGLLFFGFGPRALPFQGGLHCVQLPTKRVGVQSSGSGGSACSGAYSFDMRGYIQSGVHPGLVAGALVYCQWWSRDPLDPAGFGTSLSDALWFGIAP